MEKPRNGLIPTPEPQISIAESHNATTTDQSSSVACRLITQARLGEVEAKLFASSAGSFHTDRPRWWCLRERLLEGKVFVRRRWSISFFLSFSLWGDLVSTTRGSDKLQATKHWLWGRRKKEPTDVGWNDVPNPKDALPGRHSAAVVWHPGQMIDSVSRSEGALESMACDSTWIAPFWLHPAGVLHARFALT